MISGFDHAPIVVRDLDAAVARYTAMLGRAPSWIGRLDGARHAWFQLSNIALEVIAADGDGATGDNIRLWLEGHDDLRRSPPHAGAARRGGRDASGDALGR
jgi:catechol 2,3-dioxygenase-like lactoylglutathione lyase family enzyme